MPTTDMKQEMPKKVNANMKDEFSDAVNKSLYKIIDEMCDGTQPFFLSADEADKRSADLKRSAEELLRDLNVKKKPSR